MRIRFGWTVTLVLLGSALWSGPALAQSRLSAALRLQTFEIVWKRVKDNHYDPTFHGVDWDAVRTRYAPRVRKAQSDSKFYALLNQMLGELKQSHFGLIPPDAYLAQEETKGRSMEGEVGLTAQLVENKPIITRVTPDSPAAEAGLRPGFQLTKINGKPLDALIRQIKARKLRPSEERFEVMYGLLGRLSGPVGSTVKITYRNEKDLVMTGELKRRAPAGETSTFGELPPIPVQIETKRLENNIGYIRFSIFLMPILEPIRKAMEEMRDADGIILDVRGNLGGIGALSASIAGLFSEQRGTLGTMKMRKGEMRFVVFPAPQPYKGPLVILTDEASLSTSEILAGGMQESRRATIIGRPTGGMVLPSAIEKLPGGARLQYAFADFTTPKGILLEGKGVTPDIPIRLTRRELLTGRDPILDAAVAHILKQKSPSASEKRPETPEGDRR